MTKVIEMLRGLNGTEGENWDEKRETIDSLLNPYKKDHTSKVVHSEFEEGGRWYNVETNVYEVKEGEEVAYFEFWNEVPASEVQEGMDLSYGFYEVEPKEVTVIKYVAK